MVQFSLKYAIALLLLAASPLQALTTKKIEVDRPGMVELKLEGVPITAETRIEWEPRQPLTLETLGPYSDGEVFIVNCTTPGEYVVACDYVDFATKQFEKYRFLVTVKGTAPPKPDVVPTPPDVTPTPTPTDVVTPAPIPKPGLRVLLVYESLDAPPKVPKPQYDAMFEGRIRDWMTANCAVGPTNVAEWRMIDKDDPFIGEDEPHWKTAAMRPRRSLPWVVISNGTTNRGYEGPVPENGDKFLELLQRFK